MSAATKAKHDVEGLRTLLFAGRSDMVHVVLDGAAVPDLLERLQMVSRSQRVCLYRGDLKQDLAEVAPYLVSLDRNGVFTDWLLEEGWGQHWGIFVVADAGLEELRRHFRKFLQVRNEDGQALYFRFYDPRVLNVYLPKCNHRDIRTVYGDVVSHYITEDENDLDTAVVMPRARVLIEPNGVSFKRG